MYKSSYTHEKILLVVVEITCRGSSLCYLRVQISKRKCVSTVPCCYLCRDKEEARGMEKEGLHND